MTEPAFTPIDLESWKRREIFHYFSSISPTTYSITEELDITELKKVLKAHSLKFYPAYLFLVTRAVTTLPPKGRELPESYSQELFLLLRRWAS